MQSWLGDYTKNYTTNVTRFENNTRKERTQKSGFDRSGNVYGLAGASRRILFMVPSHERISKHKSSASKW